MIATATAQRCHHAVSKQFGHRHWALAGLALSASAILLVLGLRPNSGFAVPSHCNDRTTGAAVDGAAESYLVALGKVEPIDGERSLSMNAFGVLRRVYVQEGDWVQKCQLLAELANDDLTARLEVAQHEGDHANARHQMLTNGPRVEEIDEARAELEALRATAENNLKLLKTRKSLHAARVVSAEELVDFQAKAEEACKRRDALAARPNQLLAGTRSEELEMARAAVASAAGKVKEATAVLEKTRLRAPMAGKIIRTLLREGESVQTLDAAPVFVLADTGRLQVRAEIDETQSQQVRAGMSVRVAVRGMPNRVYLGKVLRLLDSMGRKKVETNDPHEKVDVRVLEFIVALDENEGMRLRQRVDVTLMLGTGSRP